jgi:hypothetical protein
MVCILLSIGVAVPAQKTFEGIARSFDDYRTQNLQEKIFVHTDKSFYMAGEIIWFKVYITDAHFNRPLDMSKVCYVELLNKEHKPVFQAKLAIDHAAGDGSFQLPYSVNTGNYILRAYTNWMKNSSEDYFFEKNITIVNALKRPEWPAADAVQYDLQLFPEGGNLVNGLQTKVAFRIVDSHGKSIEGAGAVLNQRNDTIVHFKTLRFGMGHFDLTPDAGSQYHAVIKTLGGDMVSKPLPEVLAKGITMRLTELDQNRIRITIRNSIGIRTISLLAHTRELIKLATARELFNGTTEIDIDKKQIGEGITHFTVFDELNRPVCERLYFQRPETMTVQLKPDAGNYGIRRKVTIDLNTLNTKSEPVEGNLSVSVYQLDSLQTFESAGISSWLWLQSDLKGTIESPDYYFTNTGADAAEAADNLMLTQGWTRFRWEDILSGKKHEPEFLPEMEGHLINGKLVDKRNGRPAENITAYLSVPAENALFTSALSGKNGLLQFNVKNFYGSNEIVVQTNSQVDSNYRIDIATPYAEKFTNRPLPVLALSEKEKNTITAHSVQAQVANAYYADKQQSFLYPSRMDTLPFYGVPDNRYYLDDYTRFLTMEEVVREYVLEVHLRAANNKFSYKVRNRSFDQFFETSPLILLDGVPVFDGDKMVNFDPLKIKKIDVVAQKFYQNNLVHDGIVNYSTYHGDLGGYQLDANALIVGYEGLQLQREFFSPVYETADQVNSSLPDMRNLLYWSPNIKTDKKGKKTFSFYTADISGKYGIAIQGITANGLTGTTTTTFTVTQ